MGSLTSCSMLQEALASGRCRDRGEVRPCILIESLADVLPIVPYLVSLDVKRPTELTPRSIMMGETSITIKATDIKLHAQISKGRNKNLGP